MLISSPLPEGAAFIASKNPEPPSDLREPTASHLLATVRRRQVQLCLTGNMPDTRAIATLMAWCGAPASHARHLTLAVSGHRVSLRGLWEAQAVPQAVATLARTAPWATLAVRPGQASLTLQGHSAASRLGPAVAALARAGLAAEVLGVAATRLDLSLSDDHALRALDALAFLLASPSVSPPRS